MTLLSLSGNALITFGPQLALYFLYVWQTPQLTLVGISAMLFYILSLLVSSSLYLVLHGFIGVQVIPKVVYVVVGLVAQEVLRFVFFVIYQRTVKGFKHRGKQVSFITTRFGNIPAAVGTCNNNPVLYKYFNYTNNCFVVLSSIASGLGFAMIHTLVTHGTILMQEWGPGTLYATASCPLTSSIMMSYFTLTSLYQAMFAYLNVAWMVIAFQGYSKKSIWRLLVLYATHAIASITVSNKLHQKKKELQLTKLLYAYVDISKWLVQRIMLLGIASIIYYHVCMRWTCCARALFGIQPQCTAATSSHFQQEIKEEEEIVYKTASYNSANVT